MISELVSRTFKVRDCAHYAHWATASGYHHEVLKEVYENAVDFVDRMMEAHIANFDALPEVKTESAALKSDKEILKCLQADVVWIAENREEIASDLDALEAILDEMMEFYLSSIFKLKRLK